MKRTKNWRDFFTAVRPSYWIQNQPYNAKWDSVLLYLLAKYTFGLESEYIATLGPVDIWIENHPYASFHPYGLQGVRPSRSTIALARRLLLHDIGGDPHKLEIDRHISEIVQAAD